MGILAVYVRRWKISSQCLWCFLMSVFIDAFVYDPLVALIQSFLYKHWPRGADFLYSLKATKEAEIQE